jgi:hypothetical protein
MNLEWGIRMDIVVLNSQRRGRRSTTFGTQMHPARLCARLNSKVNTDAIIVSTIHFYPRSVNIKVGLLLDILTDKHPT